MIVNCQVCDKSFDFKNRREMSKHVPKVCSMQCFALLLAGHSVQKKSIQGSDTAKVFEYRSSTFRSSYERVFAELLKKESIEFFYEPYIFTLSNKSAYVPDFYLTFSGVFIETKGLWQGHSKRKFNMFFKEYEYPVYLVDKDFIRLMKKER